MTAPASFANLLGMQDDRDFESFEASELFCPKCKRSQEVRSHLLLVLPTGNQYDYRCAVCATSVGSRSDGDPSAFTVLPPKPRRPRDTRRR